MALDLFAYYLPIRYMEGDIASASSIPLTEGRPEIELLIRPSSPGRVFRRKSEPTSPVTLQSATNKSETAPRSASVATIQDLGLASSNIFFQTITSLQGFIIYRLHKQKLHINAVSKSMETLTGALVDKFSNQIQEKKIQNFGFLTGYTSNELLTSGFRPFCGEQARPKSQARIVSYVKEVSRGEPQKPSDQTQTVGNLALTPTLEPIVIHKKDSSAILATVIAIPLVAPRTF